MEIIKSLVLDTVRFFFSTVRGTIHSAANLLNQKLSTRPTSIALWILFLLLSPRTIWRWYTSTRTIPSPWTLEMWIPDSAPSILRLSQRPFRSDTLVQHPEGRTRLLSTCTTRWMRPILGKYPSTTTMEFGPPNRSSSPFLSFTRELLTESYKLQCRTIQDHTFWLKLVIICIIS